MLFFLRKFIEALLLPLGFSGLLVITGIVLRRRAIALVGVIVLYTSSTQWGGERMIAPLERVYQPTSVMASPNVDAIVTLSGGILRGTTVSGMQWGENVNRYFAGLDLAKAGKAKILVISSGPSLREGEILRQYAIRQGIEAKRILLSGRVLTTEDEARVVSEMSGIHSIVLVTSAFHMPRAALLFRGRGFDVTPFPVDQRVIGRQQDLSKFIPEAAPLKESEAAMREYYGLAVYHLIIPFQSAAPRH